MASQNKGVSLEKFVEVYNDLETYPTLIEVAAYFDVSVRTVNRWFKQHQIAGAELISRGRASASTQKVKIIQNQVIKEVPVEMDFEERLQVKKLREELSSIRSDLKQAEKQALSSDTLKEIIHGSGDHNFGSYPDWLQSTKKVHSTHGIPLLFLSDIHFDEYVDPKQLSGSSNSYNREIAVKRIQHTFNTGIDILMNRYANPKYDAIIVALGGDMLSGNIHEELAETNEDSINRSLLTLTDLLIDGIEKYADIFKKVFIPCVVGNHGRHHKKPRMKNKVFDNHEWLIYQYIARYFKHDDRVTCYIPDSPDGFFRVYNKGFLITHGDQFRGGNAIAGIFSPLMLGFHKKQKKMASLGSHFDVMMLGHFHQYVHTNQLVINGSIKGYDEFANMFNFPYEPPQQALWINHPLHGMVFRTPILCDTYHGNKKDKILQKKITILE